MADDFKRLVRAVETAARYDHVTSAPASWETVVLAALRELKALDLESDAYAMNELVDHMIVQAEGGKR